MQDRMKCRSDEGVSPSQTGIGAWLPRLDSNRHRHQAFLGFLKHLPRVALPAARGNRLWRQRRLPPPSQSPTAGIPHRRQTDPRPRPRRRPRPALPADPDGTSTPSQGLVRVHGSVISVLEGPDKGPGQEFR